VTGVAQRVVVAPADGSLGPVLRVADDRLGPGQGYGRHAHRAVDVVAVVLAGSVRHDWGDAAEVAAGDVAVLRAGTGLEHDELAGPGGARVVQTYLRAAEPDAAPTHRVLRAAAGWLDLGRPDARLWVAAVPAGGTVDLPAGTALLCTEDGVVGPFAGGSRSTAEGPATALVWEVDTARPAWAY
jgi:redox-sensitive bicupin YhaK (pirin superfamily)